MEGSHSGLVRTLGKRVWQQCHRGFESPSLRPAPYGSGLCPEKVAAGFALKQGCR